MTTPMDYPTVKVGERTYTLKYSLLAKYYLSRRGISESEMLGALAEWDRAAINALTAKQERFTIPAKWLAAVIDAWAGCVAHMYAGSAEQPPTSDQWAASLESEFDRDPGLPMEIFKKLRQAIIKVPQPSAAAPAVAADQQTQAPN